MPEHEAGILHCNNLFRVHEFEITAMTASVLLADGSSYARSSSCLTWRTVDQWEAMSPGVVQDGHCDCSGCTSSSCRKSAPDAGS